MIRSYRTLTFYHLFHPRIKIGGYKMKVPYVNYF